MQLLAMVLLTGILLTCWVESLAGDCEIGWFGSKCQYKCRCTNDNCDVDGLCTGSDTCQGGWFGPACQYADLAYRQSTTMTEITDGDDGTCLQDPDLRRVSIRMNALFTWMRVVLRKSSVNHQLKLRLLQYEFINMCTTSRNATVREGTIDIFCPSNRTVQEVIILGSSVPYLCSVYISGGRNIALKQKAVQSSTFIIHNSNADQEFAFSADLAVDGNTETDFYKGNTCSHSLPVSAIKSFWIVQLAQPAFVSRYVLYNRGNDHNKIVSHRLIGFILESFSDSVEVFQFQDTLAVSRSVYTIHGEAANVSMVKVTCGHYENILSLCEVELYGDSMCNSGYYGRECEKKCNCFMNEECFISSGGCPSGCPDGYMGEDCNTPCHRGTYGRQCVHNCSQFCVHKSSGQRACDQDSGNCKLGCEIGYQPPKCEAACGRERYGPDCTSLCSPTCGVSASDVQHVCDQFDGRCLYGCLSGYHGDSCKFACRPNMYGKGCNQPCSRGCVPARKASQSSCDHINGTCIFGCLHGFNGSLCADDKKPELVSQEQLLKIQSWPLSKSIVTVFCISAAATLLIAIVVIWFIRKDNHSDHHEDAG